jgi:hypothetical protein
MKALLATLLLALVAWPAYSQEQATPQQAPSLGTDEQNPDKQQILSVLDKYASAYDHQSMSDLLAIWPTLKDDQKLYKKTEQHFRESNIMINSVETTVEPEHLQIDHDRAVVQIVRHEKYVKVVTQAEILGSDLRGPRAGYGQLPEPNQRTYQWPVKQVIDVTLTLQKVGSDWTIVSGTEEKKETK